ncbi:hypothetical protein NXT3_PB00059 (plasmid) [Sinorhizobium fredii]|uniref:Uncharacterized protein n=1 Tax=Rhizobium fredii TaxID=380 RepID=A0A2L0HB33_RHIFR|nr:hypothetical protein NXT3_PB00059 [Sinorhizobium fredii]
MSDRIHCQLADIWLPKPTIGLLQNVANRAFFQSALCGRQLSCGDAWWIPPRGIDRVAGATFI